MNAALQLKRFLAFLQRFQMLLFFLVISTSLAAAIIVLLSIITDSSLPSDESTELINGTFDTATIERIDRPQQSNSSDLEGRTNPFEE